MSQISVAGVGVQFAGRTIIEDVTFTVSRGDRWGIVGRNGSGKTTLVNVMAGRLDPTSGTVARAGGLRITLLDQHREFGDTSVWQAAAEPFAPLMALEQSLAEHAARMSAGDASPELLARYDRELEQFAHEGGYTYPSRVDAVLQGLGFDPVHARTQPIAQLSGGEAGRIALARQLVAPADVLILDEPTNHLDLETTRWLETYLNALDASLLLISHDRAFLENVVDHILHVEHNTGTVYRGTYSSFVQQYTERRLAQERAFESQQRTIAAEEDYIRRNIAGQNSKQAKGRRKRLARVQRLSPPPGADGSMALRLETADRGGDQVLVARDVRLAVEKRVLLQDFSVRVTRGGVIGLIGPNGAGKSTLLRAIARLRPVDGGELRVGDSISLAYYRQDMAQVPLGKTLFSIIHDLRPAWDRGKVQGHLGRFGFSGGAVQRVADDLSGGERARVALAILMLSGANFLLLDEPTNHLDVESIEALEDALEDYDGTVLLVSHDRALLRNLVTEVWSLEDTRIAMHGMPFEEWEELDAARRAEEARRAEAAAAERQQQERERNRARAARSGDGKAVARALRKAVEDAEADVQRIEQQIAEVRGQLEDPSLYESAASSRQAVELKKQLDDLEEALVLAIEHWTNAVDASEREAVPAS